MNELGLHSTDFSLTCAYAAQFFQVPGNMSLEIHLLYELGNSLRVPVCQTFAISREFQEFQTGNH